MTTRYGTVIIIMFRSRTIIPIIMRGPITVEVLPCPSRAILDPREVVAWYWAVSGGCNNTVRHDDRLSCSRASQLRPSERAVQMPHHPPFLSQPLLPSASSRWSSRSRVLSCPVCESCPVVSFVPCPSAHCSSYRASL